MKYFTGQISGHVGKPYEGGIYRLFFEIPNNYPRKRNYAEACVMSRFLDPLLSYDVNGKFHLFFHLDYL